MFPACVRQILPNRWNKKTSPKCASEAQHHIYSRDSLSIELFLSQQCLLELETENPKVSEMSKIMIKLFSSYFLRRYLLLPWPDNKAVRDLSRQLAPEQSASDLSVCTSQTQELWHKYLWEHYSWAAVMEEVLTPVINSTFCWNFLPDHCLDHPLLDSWTWQHTGISLKMLWKLKGVTWSVLKGNAWL